MCSHCEIVSPVWKHQRLLLLIALMYSPLPINLWQTTTSISPLDTRLWIKIMIMMIKIMIILVIWWCEWCWIDRRGLANGLFTSSPRTMASATTYTYYYHHCYRYQNHAKLREAINIEKKDFLGNHFIKWWPPPRPPFMKSLFIYFSSIFWAKKIDDFKVVWRVLMGALRVFERCCRGCLKCVWRVFGKIKKRYEISQTHPPPTPPFMK